MDEVSGTKIRFATDEQKKFILELLTLDAVSIPLGKAEFAAGIIRAVREAEVVSQATDRDPEDTEPVAE